MDKHRILDVVSKPSDLKLLDNEELGILAQEIREEIIDVASQTGGHVASSLGAVDIIVALHSVLNCPKDKIVYDVGHQAYAHKLLTGRLNNFNTLRSYQGVSGFPRPDESEYDVHPSGHASDSLSVAFGLAKARDLSGTNEKVVAVIGDAGLAGGMAFEALNQIGQAQTPLVIILNDNEMSISPNVGALVKHLGYMRASAQYRYTRDTVQEALESGGVLSHAMVNFGRNVKESLKQFVIPRSMMFEHLGIMCTAPIDGHDIPLLRETLSAVLKTPGPVLVHVVTRKGEGYQPALDNPEKFHGVAPFDRETGVVKKKTTTAPTYTSVFGKALVEEAARDENIVALTAAMQGGTGLDAFAATFPDRFIDTGIAEGHAVGFASGLALGGKKPVVAIYSTFLQRGLDQLIINNALPRLNVVFAIDRAGIVGEDGATHNGIFDIAYTRMVPHMRVLAPSDEAELIHALHTALHTDGPFALRYPRGAGEGVAVPDVPELLEEGRSRTLRKGKDIAILAFGHMVYPSLKAAELLSEKGINARVVDMRWVKPLDTTAIAHAAKTKLVVTVEEGVLAGGVGEGVLDELAALSCETPVLTLGVNDEFVAHGAVPLLLHDAGLDPEGIAASITERCKAEGIL